MVCFHIHVNQFNFHIHVNHISFRNVISSCVNVISLTFRFMVDNTVHDYSSWVRLVIFHYCLCLLLNEWEYTQHTYAAKHGFALIFTAIIAVCHSESQLTSFYLQKSLTQIWLHKSFYSGQCNTWNSTYITVWN